jgi:hypothetical protein
MALAASLISIRIGVSVALVEILMGMLLGNIPGVRNYARRGGAPAGAANG